MEPIIKQELELQSRVARVTEKRKDIEDQLSLSEQGFRVIFEQSPIGIALIEYKTRKCIQVNQMFCNIIGYSFEELPEHTFEDIMQPYDLEQQIDRIDRLFNSEHRILHMEKLYVRKDSKTVWLNIVCVPMFVETEQTLYTFILVDDITERKQIEEEVRNLNNNLKEMVNAEIEKRRAQEQMLIQQSKMASMGEMIGLIAHQWKQPINAVGIKIQDLKDAYTYGEVDDKYIDDAVGSTMNLINFMAKTIDDFRNFFIPTRNKLLFDVNSAINELMSMFGSIFRKSNIHVSVNVEQDALLIVLGYPNEFKQVVLNILNNSKDAIVSKKKISFRIRGCINVNIGNNEDKSKIITTISDNGGGIPDDVIGQIFEPYFTTKEKEGTGIGLYMSKTIIETNMGGSLTVRNIEGGAEFSIILNAQCSNEEDIM
ncbi:sensor histidine kinase [Candidatus Magnetomonas plexicatena]|uniref:sensor histidine kinase n=1 Tax=Candidatus Magnetomonas plexicatena TaxID=2552947 RepID=UPI001101B10E|nr:PAS domain S-box protein [Nitrospirales bacterium LBB_01]